MFRKRIEKTIEKFSVAMNSGKFRDTSNLLFAYALKNLLALYCKRNQRNNLVASEKNIRLYNNIIVGTTLLAEINERFLHMPHYITVDCGKTRGQERVDLASVIKECHLNEYRTRANKKYFDESIALIGKAVLETKDFPVCVTGAPCSEFGISMDELLFKKLVSKDNNKKMQDSFGVFSKNHHADAAEEKQPTQSVKVKKVS